jgi:hypothetical protein
MNNFTDNINDAQSLLDDAKESIPESLYLTLSNINKKLYDQNQINTYIVTYLDFSIERPVQDIYKISNTVKKQYITLSDDQFAIYQNKKTEAFEKQGYFLPSAVCLIGLDLSRLVTNPMIDLYSNCCRREDDIDDCDMCCEPQIHEVSLDFDIKIVDIHKI